MCGDPCGEPRGALWPGTCLAGSSCAGEGPGCGAETGQERAPAAHAGQGRGPHRWVWPGQLSRTDSHETQAR